jgi:tetratricopeptide (TPR) repeat protein
MTFDPENKIVQLCADGMALEGKGNNRGAVQLFLQAWLRSVSNFEKFTAAHYVARHQPTIEDKLEWDKLALEFALNINDDTMKANYPSLYLNVGKCYESLNDLDSAKRQYELALAYVDFLPNDGYGKMIRTGVYKAVERFTNANE